MSNWQGPLWAWAPFDRVQSIYQSSRRSVRWIGGSGDPVLHRQLWLRKVQRDFDRRILAAHIYVEGLR